MAGMVVDEGENGALGWNLEGPPKSTNAGSRLDMQRAFPKIGMDLVGRGPLFLTGQTKIAGVFISALSSSQRPKGHSLRLNA
jgi:hypothetical protein